MKFLFKPHVLLLCIFIISCFLRLYKLDQIPIAFTHDETVLGYTAYSFLTTGADEKGNFLPLALHTFGNWTLPMYSYVTTLPIAIYGLNEFSVRLPSALAGIVGTLLIYGISYQIFKKKKLALISALFFTLSPWSIYYSRLALETNLATTFFLGGLFTLLYYFNNRNSKKLIFLSAIFFSITLFTYFTYIIVTPILVVSQLILFRKHVKKDTWSYLALFLFIAAIIISYFSIRQGSVGQLGHVSIFDNRDVLYRRVEVLRGDVSHTSALEARLTHNKYLSVPYHFAQNYLSSFSPHFLFDKGGENMVNGLGHIGHLYLIDAFFIMCGFAGLLWYRHKALYILLPWLFIGPLASSFTVDAPSATRLFVLMPLFVLFGSYGFYCIVHVSQNKIIKKSVSLTFILLFLINVLFFLDFYFIHLNVQRSRFLHYGYKQAVILSQLHPTKNVVMAGPGNFPYISFLFYNAYDPRQFQKEVVYYPQNKNGFVDVKSFGRYTFLYNIDRKNLRKNTLYIDEVKKGDKSNFIELPSGEPIFTYFITE